MSTLSNAREFEPANGAEPYPKLKRFHPKRDAIALRADQGAVLKADLQKEAPLDVSGWLIEASDLHGKPVPARVWQTGNIIPAGDATLLTGDGGTGKSLLAMQLAVATRTGREFFGQKVRRGPVLYVGAEDDAAEMHRRLADICVAEDIGLDRLDGLHKLPLAGKDAVLAAPGANNVLQPTPLWRGICQQLHRLKPALVIYDTLADLFAGNENDRAQARQFVQLLRGPAIEMGHAALLLAHPSLSGLASGTGTSGSTGWSNSVRSRLYLSRVRSEDGMECDPSSRVLKVMKANYAATGDEIAMRWQSGVFVPEEAADTESVAMTSKQQRAETVFLELLKSFKQQGRYVSPRFCAAYAPTQFAKEATGRAVGKRELDAAMRRLFDKGAIRIVETGPASKRRGEIEVVP